MTGARSGSKMLVPGWGAAGAGMADCANPGNGDAIRQAAVPDTARLASRDIGLFLYYFRSKKLTEIEWSGENESRWSSGRSGISNLPDVDGGRIGNLRGYGAGTQRPLKNSDNGGMDREIPVACRARNIRDGSRSPRPLGGMRRRQTGWIPVGVHDRTERAHPEEQRGDPSASQSAADI